MSEDKLVIPEFSMEDFVSTTAPYEWLYKFKDDKFKLSQAAQMMKIYANSIGIKNFMTLWKEYYKSISKKQNIVLDNATNFEDQKLELLTGSWLCDEYGVTGIDKYGAEIVACPHPIMPVKRLINIDTGTEKMEITFKRRGRGWKNVIIDKKTIASANKIVDLSEFGIAVNSENAKHLVKYFTEVESLNDDKIPEINSVERLGWIDGYGFSPYVDNLVFDGNMTYKHFFDSVHTSGSFLKWMEAAKIARNECIITRIMLAASFASVLVKPCNALTFFVHLWGGTESGKTVGLMLAASIWANPAMGAYIHTFNSTQVGQELSATFVNSLPLMIDELQIVSDRKDFDKMIYTLAEGMGRSRGAKSGGLQKVGSWQNCIMTTGEQPITNAGSAGGAINRIIEIDCKDEKLFRDPVGMVDMIRKNYGFAGKMFVEKLTEDNNIEYAANLQKKFYQRLNQGENTEKQIMAASVILTADQLINEWIFHDDKTLKISDIQPFLATKKSVSANERAYEFIFDFIAINRNKFMTNSFGEYDGECWGVIEDEYIYIIKTQFDKLMRDNGFNSMAFLSWAKSNGTIRTARQRNTILKRISGSPVNCVAILRPKTEDEDVKTIDDEDLPV